MSLCLATNEGKVASKTLKATKNKKTKPVIFQNANSKFSCININIKYKQIFIIANNKILLRKTNAILFFVSAKIIGGIINIKDKNIAGKYTRQCCCKSKFTAVCNNFGIEIKNDVCKKLNNKIPKFNKHKFLLVKTNLIKYKIFCLLFLCRPVSGKKYVIKNAGSVKNAVIAKIPFKLIIPYKNGAATNEIANIKAIDEPIIAIALVKCLGIIKSAANAETTPENAPAPCNARAIVNCKTESAKIPTTLPSQNKIKPI